MLVAVGYQAVLMHLSLLDVLLFVMMDKFAILNLLKKKVEQIGRAHV